MSAPIYRVTGRVTAPDGTAYEPIYWGSFYTAAAVLHGIADGARERGEVATARLDRGPDTARIAWVRVGTYELAAS